MDTRAARAALERYQRELIAEALAMAASRHESYGHQTRGNFRYAHFKKAEDMRRLRQEIKAKADGD